MKIRYASLLFFCLNIQAQDQISKADLLNIVTHIPGIQGIINDYLEAHDQAAHSFRLNTDQSDYICAFSPDSSYFAYADKKRVKIVHTKSPIKDANIDFLADTSVSALAFDALSKQIAIAAGKRVAVQDIQTKTDLCSNVRSALVTAVAYSPDNRYFASGTRDGSIKMCAPSTYKTIKRFHTDAMTIRDLAFSSQSNTMIAGGFSDVQIFDVKQGSILQKLGFCAPLVLAPQGNQLALFQVGSIQLHKLDQESDICVSTTLVSKKTHEFKGCNTEFAFGPRAHSLATGVFGTNQVRVWDTKTGKLLYTLEQDGEVEKLLYSPDGTYLVCISDNKTVQFWQKQAWC